MKHLIILYNIYFIMLMIVPCNHTMLYGSLIENVFGVHLQEHCDHNHHQEKEDNNQQDSSNHHHSCTPFCACGISHFVLDAPPFQLAVVNQFNRVSQTNIIQSTVWAPTSNEYASLMVNDIWHPPQRV